MGWHVCEYCRNETSSGDVTLEFDSGRCWIMPDMVLHYVANHCWLPPVEFINDVLHGILRGYGAQQTKGIPIPVGYLSGEYPIGNCPPDFFQRLWQLMRQAQRSGDRRQTRGLQLNSFDPTAMTPEHRVRYSVEPTGHHGCDSGRKRFCVTCRDCAVILHDNTTGPEHYIKIHEDASHS